MRAHVPDHPRPHRCGVAVPTTSMTICPGHKAAQGCLRMSCSCVYLLSATPMTPLICCYPQELLTRFQGWRGHSQEAKRASAGGHRHPRHVKRLGRFSSRVWSPGCPCSRCGACSVPLPGGQPWTPTVTLPQGRNGLHAWRMAVLSPWRERSLGRYVHGACMRRTLLDLAPIISATVCHQRNDVERYSRCTSVRDIV
jgi:hypothetical protein